MRKAVGRNGRKGGRSVCFVFGLCFCLQRRQQQQHEKGSLSLALFCSASLLTHTRIRIHTYIQLLVTHALCTCKVLFLRRWWRIITKNGILFSSAGRGRMFCSYDCCCCCCFHYYSLLLSEVVCCWKKVQLDPKENFVDDARAFYAPSSSSSWGSFSTFSNSIKSNIEHIKTTTTATLKMSMSNS